MKGLKGLGQETFLGEFNYFCLASWLWKFAPPEGEPLVGQFELGGEERLEAGDMREFTFWGPASCFKVNDFVLQPLRFILPILLGVLIWAAFRILLT